MTPTVLLCVMCDVIVQEDVIRDSPLDQTTHTHSLCSDHSCRRAESMHNPVICEKCVDTHTQLTCIYH